MNNSARVHIDIAEYVRLYGALADNIVKAVSDELLREVRKNARNDFNDDSGLLRKSIGKRKSKLDPDMLIVGAFAPHAHLVEFGTGMRISPKTGKVSGHMPATLFFTAAVESVNSRLEAIVRQEVDKLQGK